MLLSGVYFVFRGVARDNFIFNHHSACRLACKQLGIAVISI